MGSYYYLEDPDSEFGTTPVPEDEYLAAVLRIAKKKGIEITDEMILEELEEIKKRRKR